MKKTVLFFGCLLLSSCLYEAMYHLTDEDFTWIEPYEQGDTVLFISSERMDTMLIEKKSVHDCHWPFRENEGSEILYGNCGFDYTIFHKGKKISSYAYFIKEDEHLLSVSLKFNMRQFDSAYKELQELGLQEVVINGMKYDDAIIVNYKNSVLYNSSPYNCSFIWSKSKGLIQYTYKDGDTYTIYKKLPHRNE